MKIKIHKGNNADSRTATNKSKEALLEDTLKHRKNVRDCMNLLSYMLTDKGSQHDHTKLTEFDKFYKDFMGSPKEFTKGEWYNIHIVEEKHHMTKHKHEDINLLDIIEHIVDIVVAGKARSGKVNKNFDDMDADIVMRAYDNTIDLIDSLTELGE